MTASTFFVLSAIISLLAMIPLDTLTKAIAGASVVAVAILTLWFLVSEHGEKLTVAIPMINQLK